MKKKDFINWVADRFVHVYGEPDNCDFVMCLRGLAEELPDEHVERVLPIMGNIAEGTCDAKR